MRDWRKEFEKYQKMTVAEQLPLKHEMVALFRDFWYQPNMSEDLFSQCLTSIIICPEMLYIMSGRENP